MIQFAFTLAEAISEPRNPGIFKKFQDKRMFLYLLSKKRNFNGVHSFKNKYRKLSFRTFTQLFRKKRSNVNECDFKQRPGLWIFFSSISKFRGVTNGTVKMNFRIIFAFVGFIVSMVDSLSYVDGMGCIEQVVCDQNGFEYPTQCDFDESRENNPTLQIAPCRNNDY